MKKVIILFILTTLKISPCSPQNTSHIRHQVYFDLGGQTSCFFGDKIIMPDTSALTRETKYQYIGYTIKSGTSFHICFSHNMEFKKNFIFEYGLLFNNRAYKYQSKTENLSKYAHFLEPFDDIIEYNFADNNLEIRIGLGYKLKRLYFITGSKILIASSTYAKTTNINGLTSTGREKLLFCFSNHKFNQYFYPEFFVYYKFRFAKEIFNVYLGVDDFIPIKNKKPYNLSIFFGVRISLNLINNLYEKP